MMKTFTFDDWLNDRIPESIFLHDKNNPMNNSDLNHVLQCQESAYDMATEMMFDHKKQFYLNSISGISDPNLRGKFHQQEVKWNEMSLNRDQEYIQLVTMGLKQFHDITGGTYQKIQAKYLHWKEGKDSIEEADLPDSRTFPLGAFIKYSIWLDEQPGTNAGRPGGSENRTRGIEFKNLFKKSHQSDEKIQDMKTILKTSGYIDVSGNWAGVTKKMNELATLYHYFSDNQILLSHQSGPGLMSFYKEFGLLVEKKTGPGVYTVTKNLTRHPGRSTTYIDFETKFKAWIK